MSFLEEQARDRERAEELIRSLQVLSAFAERFSGMTSEDQEAIQNAGEGADPGLVEDRRLLRALNGVWTEDLLETLVSIRRSSVTQFQFDEALRLLERLGVNTSTKLTRMVDKAVSAQKEAERQLKKELATAGGTGERTELVRVGELDLPDLPDSAMNLVVPPGYELSGGGIRRLTARGGAVSATPICNRPLLVTGKTAEPGAKPGQEYISLRLTMLYDDSWVHITLPREDALNAGKLQKIARLGLDSHTNNAAWLAEYISAFEARNGQQIRRIRSATSLGAQGREGAGGFLFGRHFIFPDGRVVLNLDSDLTDPSEWKNGAISFRGLDKGDEQIANGFRRSPRGTLSGWNQMMRKVAGLPKVMTCFYASLAAPLLRVLRIANFMVDLSGTTSQGKSTAQLVAGAPYGYPDPNEVETVVHSWDNTPAFYNRAPAVINDLPLILDDSRKVEKEDPKRITQLIYKITAGKSQGQASANSEGLKEFRAWRTVVISSGERPLTTFDSEAGGAKGRVITLYGLPFGAENDETERLVKEVTMGTQRHYGFTGLEWVSWIVQNQNERAGQWLQRYLDIQARFASGNGVQRRLANYAAAIVVAGQLYHEAMAEIGIELSWEFTDPLEPIWDEVVAEASDATSSQRALQELYGWAARTNDRFWRDGYSSIRKPDGGWAGRWDYDKAGWTYIGIAEDVLAQRLKDLGFSAPEILRKWRDAGWLEIPPSRAKKTFTMATNAYGSSNKVPMIRIKRSALVELGLADPSDSASQVDAAPGRFDNKAATMKEDALTA